MPSLQLRLPPTVFFEPDSFRARVDSPSDSVLITRRFLQDCLACRPLNPLMASIPFRSKQISNHAGVDTLCDKVHICQTRPLRALSVQPKRPLSVLRTTFVSWKGQYFMGLCTYKPEFHLRSGLSGPQTARPVDGLHYPLFQTNSEQCQG